MAQRESSSIKRYASAFSNIYIYIYLFCFVLFCFLFFFWFFKLKRLTQNSKAELKRFWVGSDSGTK